MNDAIRQVIARATDDLVCWLTDGGMDVTEAYHHVLDHSCLHDAWKHRILHDAVARVTAQQWAEYQAEMTG